MHTNMLFGLPDLKHSTVADDKDNDRGGGDGGSVDDATGADSLEVCFAIAFSTLFGSRFFFSTFSYLAKVHTCVRGYTMCVCV